MTIDYSNQGEVETLSVPSEADLLNSEIENVVKTWIKLKSLLVKTNSLPAGVTALDTAKTNYIAESIDLVEFEYEIIKVGNDWAALMETKRLANDWDFFTLLE